MDPIVVDDSRASCLNGAESLWWNVEQQRVLKGRRDDEKKRDAEPKEQSKGDEVDAFDTLKHDPGQIPISHPQTQTARLQRATYLTVSSVGHTC